MANKQKRKKPSTTKKGQKNVSRQRGGVILFAVGILVGILSFVKGDGLWGKLHSLMFGLLGWSFYFVAPIIIYIAVLTTQDKDDDFIKRKSWQAGVLILLISGTIETVRGLPPANTFARTLREMYLNGTEGKGGGVLGILTAGPLSLIGSKPIPQILIVITLFVFIMLVTGSSLKTLYTALRKPVDTAKVAIDDYRVNRENVIEEEKQLDQLTFKTEKLPEEKPRFDIDVNIDDDATPEELEKVQPLETIEHDLKNVPLNDPTAEIPVVETYPLSDWGTDRPVEYVSVADALEETISEINEERPHPLETDIEEAKQEDAYRVVQDYLDSIRTGDTGEVEYPVAVKKTHIDIDEQEYPQIEPEPEQEPEPEPQPEEVVVETFLANVCQPQVEQKPQLEEKAEYKPYIDETINEPTAQPLPVEQPVAEKRDEVLEQFISKATAQKAVTAPTQEGKPTFAYDGYQLPPLELLVGGDNKPPQGVEEELRDNAEKLVTTLESFGVETKIINVTRGPSVTRYELQPSPGVKISRITGLADDIALNLAAAGIRIEAPIPGKAAVGVEVPNKNISIVRFKEIIQSNEFENARGDIIMALGRDITGTVKLADIAKMPHMLIAGATGSGKSVCINALIMSIIYKYSPDEVKLIMIDPKMVELGVYNGIPHLLTPVVTDPKKAAGALAFAVKEMISRYNDFAENGVRDIAGYNKLAEKDPELQPMAKIVIIIDELADLMLASPSEVEDSICRLAQMARAAGMHLVIATQRPSVDVITGVIKANIPSRIAFAVSSQVDSRTILDMGGAEKLLGNGDMLFYPVGFPKPLRVQGSYVSDKEVETVVEYIKKRETANYDLEIVEEIERLAITPGLSGVLAFEEEDEYLPFAIETVVEAGQASVSMLQRRLSVGHSRAGKLMDQMEARGIVGPHEGSKPRQVLITKEEHLEMKLAGLDQPGAVDNQE